jgi:acetoacetyl-CoA synthetase
MEWLKDERRLSFASYQDLWRWSVTDIEDFWETIWEYFDIRASKNYTKTLTSRKMPRAKWFVGSELNYAEHIFRNNMSDNSAVLFAEEDGRITRISWYELGERTASFAEALRSFGVKRGDRIAAYLSNRPEAVMAFLACASIGAIWSSCSPDFGSSSVIDRFKQIEPKILIAANGYRYDGKYYDKMDSIKKIQASIKTIDKTVIIPYKNESSGTNDEVLWNDLTNIHSKLSFEQVPFDHPLWILYSSGTTGLPKPIVHGHGGILLEHYKTLSLHNDLKSNDSFFWFTTTGWMMWPYLVSGLLVGAEIILYDGSPSFPDANALWSLAEKAGMTFFGTSAAYIAFCMKSRLNPSQDFDLEELKGIGSTGSPLSSDGFRWVYGHVKKDLWLASISGGTDLCTAFVGGCYILPVRAGEIQCICLGAKVEAFNERGRSVLNEMGELVITEPMPSMPIYFWNDEGDKRYLESYFETFPGVWRHGDWIKIDEDGSCVIYGRSDATIKRFGVRIGTSEIYSVVESMQEIAEGLVVDLEFLGGRSHMPLFVVLKKGIALNGELRARIKSKIREELSPRFIPDEIYSVHEIPKTLNGKKLEVPVRRILLGLSPEKAFNPDSLSNPNSMKFFMRLAKKMIHELDTPKL